MAAWLLLLLWACNPARLRPLPDELGAFASRTDFLQRLEPRGERILHGAGLSLDPLSAERARQERARPALLAAYYDLHGLRPDWHLILRNALGQQEGFVLLQLDLGLSLEGRAYDERVAQGQYDEALDLFCFGLRYLGRPVLLRLGYEFNNPWYGYAPEEYRRAWQRAVQILRERWRLKNVALVWCYAADGRPDYLSFYPGDEYVDWWSIDASEAADLGSPATLAFMDEARARGFPVLVAAATPPDADLSQGEEVWQDWFAPLLGFLRRHPNVKAFTYLTWDWEHMSRRADPILVERYRMELSHPVYQHAAPLEELRWHLEWED
jgi:hypothetical protein